MLILFSLHFFNIVLLSIFPSFSLAFKYERSHSTAASSSSSKFNAEHMPASTESQALKEAQNKYKLLEADYKSLHEKRLQDVSIASIKVQNRFI